MELFFSSSTSPSFSRLKFFRELDCCSSRSKRKKIGIYKKYSKQVKAGTDVQDRPKILEPPCVFRQMVEIQYLLIWFGCWGFNRGQTRVNTIVAEYLVLYRRNTVHLNSELRVIGTYAHRINSYFLHLTMHIKPNSYMQSSKPLSPNNPQFR